MGLPQLETCCFIFDLKTGNIILGCINAVLSFTMLVVMIVAASIVGTEISAEKGSKAEILLELEGSTLAPIPMDFDEIERRAGETGLYAMCIILALMFTAKFCFDIFFVYGVVTERAGIIKAYVIMWMVFFILHTFVFFLNVMGFGAGTICTELFYIGLNVYLILLVRSYYKLLNSREEV